jgi:predicted Zn-dependent peptidase
MHLRGHGLPLRGSRAGFKGTERRPAARDISETIDGVGGVLNGGTDKELTAYWAKVARPHFDLALDLVVDMLRNSRFDPADIENERKVIIEELNMCVDSPQSRVDILIDETVWPDQPLGRDVAGSKETVAAIDRPMIADYVAGSYLPNTTVVAVAGDIAHEEVVGSVSAMLSDWAQGSPASWSSSVNDQASPRFVAETRKTEQAHLCLAVRGIPHGHPDRFNLDLLNLVLGEGMSSRLFLEIRERLGLAYEIHSHISHFHDSGSVNVCAGVDPRSVEQTVEAILGELVRLKEEAVSDSEVAKARELGKGRLMLRMEDTRSVAGWVGGQELLTGNIRTVDEVVSILDAATAADLQRVAQDLFRPDRLSLALVGPGRGRKRVERMLAL